MKKLRADANLRREALLDAANAVFTEHGVTAPLDMVIKRAGFGRATLYRNFADRTSLMAALLHRTLDELAHYGETCATRDDAFFLLLQEVAEVIVRSAPVVDFWRAVDRDHEVLVEARRRVTQLFRAPLRRAIKAGLCRPDVRPADTVILMAMLGGALSGKSLAVRRQIVHRSLYLLQMGLRHQSTVDESMRHGTTRQISRA